MTPTDGSVPTVGPGVRHYDAGMPSALRAQVALIGLVAVLLIPIGTSSLRGLTHVLTCREASATPFSVQVPADGPPVISSATVIERGTDGEVASPEVCGGLVLDLRMATADRDDRAHLVISLDNRSDYGWRGSLQLDFGGVDVPVTIGHVEAGATATEEVEVRLDRERSYEIAGTLLVGP